MGLFSSMVYLISILIIAILMRVIASYSILRAKLMRVFPIKITASLIEKRMRVFPDKKTASYYKRLRFKTPDGYVIFSTRRYATLLNKKEPYNTNLDINVTCISSKTSIEIFLHGWLLAQGIVFKYRQPYDMPGFPEAFNRYLERTEQGIPFKMQNESDSNAATWKIQCCITNESYLRIYYKQFEGCWIFVYLMTDTETFQPGINEANQLVNSIYLV